MSESNASSDLRAMGDSVEKKPVTIVVSAECPITDFGKDVTAEVNTEYAFHLPHQIGAGSESADLAAHSGVECFVEIVAATEPDIRSEPVILSRDGLVQFRVEDRRELVRDLHLGGVNHSIGCRATSGPFQVKRIQPCLQSRFFCLNKAIYNLSDFLSNPPAQRADWNGWFIFEAV